MHSGGVRERGCEGVAERGVRVWGREGGGEREENDVKWGKVSEKEPRTFC